MLEAILFFVLGFIIARLTQARIQPDILLYWNKECLGWRPVASKADICENTKYLAAIEVEPTQVSEDVE